MCFTIEKNYKIKIQLFFCIVCVDVKEDRRFVLYHKYLSCLIWGKTCGTTDSCGGQVNDITAICGRVPVPNCARAR